MKKLLFMFTLVLMMCSCTNLKDIADLKDNLRNAVYVSNDDSLYLEFYQSTYHILSSWGKLIIVGNYKIEAIHKYYLADGETLTGDYALFIESIQDDTYQRTKFHGFLPPDHIQINGIIYWLKGIV